MVNHIENSSRRRDNRGCRGFRFSRPRSIVACLGFTFAASMNAACYRYVPISKDAPTSNEDVRVHITEDAAARLSKDLGVFSTSIEGQYAPQGKDSVSVAVSIAREYQGVTVGTTTQMLYLGRSEVVDVRRRQFDRGRTVLLSAGIVAGFAALAASIVQIGDPNDPSDSRPIQPPPSMRRPAVHAFTVRLPLP